MNYKDLARPSVRERHPEIMELLSKGDLVLPAVYLDGDIVSLGYVDYFSISKAVEQTRKAAVSQPTRTDD